MHGPVSPSIIFRRLLFSDTAVDAADGGRWRGSAEAGRDGGLAPLLWYERVLEAEPALT